MLHALLIDSVDDPLSSAAKLLGHFVWTVIPTMNPDGYVYSREHSRMWRKNRQDVGGLVCKGESGPCAGLQSGRVTSHQRDTSRNSSTS